MRASSTTGVTRSRRGRSRPCGRNGRRATRRAPAGCAPGSTRRARQRPPDSRRRIRRWRAAVEPDAWATLTHGDIAPSNDLRATDGWRRLDFEYAGVRHALYDALLWTLFCPFPLPLIERADTVYRAAIAGAFPPARDDGDYARARADVAAGRSLDLLRWQPPALLDRDREWAPGLTARRAVLLASRALPRRRGRRRAPLAPFAATLEALHRRLGARWNAERECGFDWPAFGDDRLWFGRDPVRHTRAPALPDCAEDLDAVLTRPAGGLRAW